MLRARRAKSNAVGFISKPAIRAVALKLQPAGINLQRSESLGSDATAMQDTI